MREHAKEELSFYSDSTSDIEYKYPFGWGELWGVASRTDYDLTQHETFSSEDLKYHDLDAKKKYLPYVVEPALGLNRLFLAVLCDAYEEEKLEKDEIRTVLRFGKRVSPMKVAIFPLMKKDGLDLKAKEIYSELRNHWYVDYDDSGAIGKRYRRHDEIGTPYCITVDYDTMSDGTVTVRERDSMKQERIPVTELKTYLINRMV